MDAVLYVGLIVGGLAGMLSGQCSGESTSMAEMGEAGSYPWGKDNSGIMQCNAMHRDTGYVH